MPTTRELAFEQKRYAPEAAADYLPQLLAITEASTKLSQLDQLNRDQELATGGVLSQSSASQANSVLDYIARKYAARAGVAAEQIGAVASLRKPMIEAAARGLERVADTTVIANYYARTRDSGIDVPGTLTADTNLKSAIAAMNKSAGGAATAESMNKTRGEVGGTDQDIINAALGGVLGNQINMAGAAVGEALAGRGKNTGTHTAMELEKQLVLNQLSPAVQALEAMGLSHDAALASVKQFAYGRGNEPGAINNALYANNRLTDEDKTYATEQAPDIARGLTAEAQAEATKLGIGLSPEDKDVEGKLYQYFLNTITGDSAMSPESRISAGLRAITDAHQEPAYFRVAQEALWGEAKRLAEDADPYMRKIGQWAVGDPVTGAPPIIPNLPAVAAAIGYGGDPYAVQKTVEFFAGHPRALLALQKAQTDPNSNLAALSARDSNATLADVQEAMKQVGLPAGRNQLRWYEMNPAVTKRLEAYVGPTTLSQAAAGVSRQLVGMQPKPNPLKATVQKNMPTVPQEGAKAPMETEADVQAQDGTAAAPAGSEAGAAASPVSSQAMPVEAEPTRPTIQRIVAPWQPPEKLTPVQRNAVTEPVPEEMEFETSAALTDPAKVRAELRAKFYGQGGGREKLQRKIDEILGKDTAATGVA